MSELSKSREKKVTDQKNLVHVFNTTLFVHEEYSGPKTTIWTQLQQAKRSLEMVVETGNKFLSSWKFTGAVASQLMEEEWGTPGEAELFLNDQGELVLRCLNFGPVDPNPDSGSGPASKDERLPVDVDSLIEFSDNPESLQVGDAAEAVSEKISYPPISELREQAEACGLDPSSFGRSKRALFEMLEQVRETGVIPEDLRLSKDEEGVSDPQDAQASSTEEEKEDPPEDLNSDPTPRTKTAEAISEPEILNPEVLESIPTTNKDLNIDKILSQAERMESEEDLDSMVDIRQENVDPDMLQLQNLDPDDIEGLPDDFEDNTVFESVQDDFEIIGATEIESNSEDSDFESSDPEPDPEPVPKRKVSLDLHALSPSLDPGLESIVANISSNSEDDFSFEDLN